MKQTDCSKRRAMVHTSVSIPHDTYQALKAIATEFNVSIASVIRYATEKRLNEYLGTVRYIDRKQAEKIYNTTAEIADNSRLILSNIRRIGINYNQELKLKNAEQKYHSVLNSSTASSRRRIEAYDEYQKAVADAEKNYLNKDELYDLLSRFEIAAEEMKVASCLIQE